MFDLPQALLLARIQFAFTPTCAANSTLEFVALSLLTPLADMPPVLAERSAHPCLSGACFGCTDQAAGSSSSSASAAAAVACTLSGAWCAGA